jgi:septation ring formation regulator EzrA
MTEAAVDNERRFTMLETTLNSINDNLKAINLGMDEVRKSIAKIEALEERQNNSSAAIERAFSATKEVERKVEKNMEVVEAKFAAHAKTDDDHHTMSDSRSQANTDRIQAVDTQVTKWVNRMIGVWMAASLLLSVIQLLIVGYATDIKNEVVAHRNDISALQTQVSVLSQVVDPTHSKLQSTGK